MKISQKIRDEHGDGSTAVAAGEPAGRPEQLGRARGGELQVVLLV